jgi:hypothetical protein
MSRLRPVDEPAMHWWTTPLVIVAILILLAGPAVKHWRSREKEPEYTSGAVFWIQHPAEHAERVGWRLYSEGREDTIYTSPRVPLVEIYVDIDSLRMLP